MECFGLFRDDAQDRDQWILKIRREPANLDLCGKWPLKWRLHDCA